ncbi:Gfo/Idh/MocA family protein [Actinomadura harenae]|uniref:Gfo/Idh/MocA family oxidoreductase n=1 Tax=Actinomadura harenae TaxID=2483351 RepID=A0A3M2LGJ1_9ACTN|nr:Gfo/Idh/MocA family oxidoreductase [Actinomadura harenae]RMI33858.1 gfo/Idh/MocA family oxidoreductase [Actinomadura harenae]
MDDRRPLRIGVLGCASIAERQILPALARMPEARVTAVASRSAARAHEFAARFGGTPVHGYERLLERGDVDAVYIPLPAALHAEWTERALRGGRHVLVEKPLTTGREETARLAALARSLGLRLMENRMFAHHPQHTRVRELIANGAVGKLRTLSAALAFPPRPPDDIRYDPALGGGALLDVGYYPVQAAMMLLPGSLTVAGAVLHHDTGAGVDTGGDVLLRGEGDVAAHLTFGFRHAYRSRYEVWGSRGRIILDRAFTPPSTWQPVLHLEQQDREERLALSPANHYQAALECFVRAVRDDGAERAALETALDDAVRCASLLDAVRAAASAYAP